MASEDVGAADRRGRSRVQLCRHTRRQALLREIGAMEFDLEKAKKGGEGKDTDAFANPSRSFQCACLTPTCPRRAVQHTLKPTGLETLRCADGSSGVVASGKHDADMEQETACCSSTTRTSTEA